jgi:hypothetical protein
MSRLIILPTPISSSSLALGQLIADPFRAESPVFVPSLKQECRSTKQPGYQETIVHDDKGHFLATTSENSHASQDNVVVLKADESVHTSLAQPRLAFDSIRRDAATQAFLRQTAPQHQSLYYVTGIQRIHNPSFRRAAAKEGGVAEASDGEIRLPMHVRRVDSAANITEAKGMNEVANDSILAVELLKVRCRVGDASAPHEIDDVDYAWSYHRFEDADLQLAIGLGKALEPSEFRSLAGILEHEDLTGSWDYRSHGDGGLGGF